jgi:hypothetical protein
MALSLPNFIFSLKIESEDKVKRRPGSGERKRTNQYSRRLGAITRRLARQGYPNYKKTKRQKTAIEGQPGKKKATCVLVSSTRATLFIGGAGNAV